MRWQLKQYNRMLEIWQRRSCWRYVNKNSYWFKYKICTAQLLPSSKSCIAESESGRVMKNRDSRPTGVLDEQISGFHWPEGGQWSGLDVSSVGRGHRLLRTESANLIIIIIVIIHRTINDWPLTSDWTDACDGLVTTSSHPVRRCVASISLASKQASK